MTSKKDSEEKKSRTKKLIEIFWDRSDPDLIEIEESEYRDRLINSHSGSSKKKRTAKRAFEAAYDLRKFEIEMYWKRANYFWTFIAAVFTGYGFMIREGSGATIEPFALSCIGTILSYAWWTTNRGSKAWQRHWEKHLDMLENQFMGPLYKTVAMKKTYSVSKSNEIVSFVFIIFWTGIGIYHLFEKSLVNVHLQLDKLRLEYWIAIAITALAVCALENGHGRGRFGKRKFKMYSRNPKYDSD